MEEENTCNCSKVTSKLISLMIYAKDIMYHAFLCDRYHGDIVIDGYLMGWWEEYTFKSLSFVSFFLLEIYIYILLYFVYLDVGLKFEERRQIIFLRYFENQYNFLFFFGCCLFFEIFILKISLCLFHFFPIPLLLFISCLFHGLIFYISILSIFIFLIVCVFFFNFGRFFPFYFYFKKFLFVFLFFLLNFVSFSFHFFGNVFSSFWIWSFLLFFPSSFYNYF